MKVKMQDGYKDIYTLSDVERAKIVISAEKKDESDNKGREAIEYAETAVREILNSYGEGDYLDRIIEANAETARNSRIWDAYGEGSGDMDIWISFIAKTSNGYMEGGAYLSDIWQVGACDVAGYMFSLSFTRR